MMAPTCLLTATLALGVAQGVPAGPSGDDPFAARPESAALSWDLLGGGVPDGGALLRAELGFSRLLEAGVEVPVVDGFLMGATIGIDVGHFTPSNVDFGDGVDGALVFGLTGRYRLVHDSEWTIGLRAGLLGSAQLGRAGGGVRVPLRVSALYAIDRTFLLGAMVDAPIRLEFPARLDAIFSFPLVVGLAAEFHLLPSLALTAMAGLGPALDTRGVETAFRGQIGVGYRL
ncbi:MAG: hypothetical protein AAFZ18_25485 [Myxococcota bacterium]